MKTTSVRNPTPCTRRDFLRTLALAGGALGAGALTPQWALADAATRPAGKKLNFVFILMDDLGWKDVGCYGSTFYETPNIDRLAAEGMRFTNAYAACPVCSPTRASILTGKYPARIGLTNFIGGMKKDKLIPPDYLKQLPLEEFTLAEAFQQAGYTTLFLGKWHLGGEGFSPDKQGFRETVGVNATKSYFPPYKCPTLPDGPPDEYLTDRLTSEACTLLDKHKTEPFVLYLAHFAVHVPLKAKKDLIAKYAAKAAQLPPAAGPTSRPEGPVPTRLVQDHPVYAAMVQSMDESVGRILAKLKELGLEDNTAVIFMSDNGGLATAEGWPTANLPLRAGKGWLYEGGIREPMIIKWPGVTRPGSVCAVPVISTDFYPTMLAMAGLPAQPQQHVDGISLVPLLRSAAPPERTALYWHYPHYSNQGGGQAGAVRAGDFKLIEFYEDHHVELYNLQNDLEEQHNLAEQRPEKAAELRQMLARWRQTVGAKMPTPARQP